MKGLIVIAILLFLYLGYALFNPEKF
ncbi:K(+)-transporting ATPase subunit F [Clostridium tagluense]|nr:K(+)-transporting ATPase subunit F [Clostridium sp. FP2]MBZ9632787.1 K(+)-transporting ATPase subunit F [Clostridium sp. FP1]MCB2299823.1 K(+)-transporting ATPase subunit F [Clostridium tagluense]MCB2313482.1 K(+)-transporting ATPase subunit F [Clostridium tagluense]MCB2318306.1 K(+)-transporting ATPase subunit F [Clostridium tagluense]